MSIWPVFVWRLMFEEFAEEFSVGQEVAWLVEIVDGQKDSWPPEVLVDTTATIERPPNHNKHAAIARTADFRVLWFGDEPAGTEMSLRAGLRVEKIAPWFHTTAHGVIQRIEIVSRRAAWDADHTRVWATGEWHLQEVQRSPGYLGPHPRRSDPPERLFQDGLLVTLDLESIAIV